MTDFSNVTDLELVRELKTRINNSPNSDVDNVAGYEVKHANSTEIEFYIDDGNETFCIPTFTFDKNGALTYVENTLNCSFEEKLDEYFDNHAGEFELLELAQRCLRAYGV